MEERQTVGEREGRGEGVAMAQAVLVGLAVGRDVSVGVRVRAGLALPPPPALGLCETETQVVGVCERVADAVVVMHGVEVGEGVAWAVLLGMGVDVRVDCSAMLPVPVMDGEMSAVAEGARDVVGMEEALGAGPVPVAQAVRVACVGVRVPPTEADTLGEMVEESVGMGDSVAAHVAVKFAALGLLDREAARGGEGVPVALAFPDSVACAEAVARPMGDREGAGVAVPVELGVLVAKRGREGDDEALGQVEGRGVGVE